MKLSGPIAHASAAFITAALHRDFPSDVIDLAKMCLADWYAVALGAYGDACCGFAHAPTDAGRKLYPQISSVGAKKATVHVHPLGPKVAGQAPLSPLAAKFGIA